MAGLRLTPEELAKRLRSNPGLRVSTSFGGTAEREPPTPEPGPRNQLRVASKTSEKSDSLLRLYRQLALLDIAPPVAELQFHVPGLRNPYRFDFAYPDDDIALEYEGGVFVPGGSHQQSMRYASDCRKYTLAAIEGWRVLRFTVKDIDSGFAAAATLDAINQVREP